jgi:predicted ATP-dependent endonuclease of OLD family
MQGKDAMQLKSIRIENFRSIEDLTVNFESFTALVGANNSGKSTILKAIENFFDAAPKLSDSDFFMKKTDRTISITCLFHKFVPSEREEFGSSIIDEELSVSREFSKDGKDSGIYSVQVLSNPDFEQTREAAGAVAKRAAYKKLREEAYAELPVASTAEAADAALKAWEEAHQDQLKKTRVKGFFGAPNVANGKLKKRTSVNLIPAVKDVNLEIGKRSPVLALLTSITEQTIKNQEEFQSYLDESSKKFAELTDPSSISQLKSIGEQLTFCLQQYYPDARLTAEWDQTDTLLVNFPSPRISVGHRDIDTSIDFVGHGLQRAVLFSVVQYLAQQEPTGQPVKGTYEEPQSDIILLIEEPEIFQHPGKQELIYEALLKVCDAFNTETGIRFQVAYTTHSEKLVDIKNFGGVRVLRKNLTQEHILRSYCAAYSIDLCRESLRVFKGERQVVPREAFLAKLHIFTREISEGFFAEKVILVEGVSDKAILEGAYRAQGINPKKKGIFVISVEGKTKLDRPALIFKGLKIPTYLVVDNDEKERDRNKKAHNAELNKLLQALSGFDEIKDFPTDTYANIAFFDGDLEKYLKSITGDNYSILREKVANDFGIYPSDMVSRPLITQ